VEAGRGAHSANVAERARIEDAMATLGRPATDAGNLIDGQQVPARAHSAWAKRERTTQIVGVFQAAPGPVMSPCEGILRIEA
jgi:hypothetical protein